MNRTQRSTESTLEIPSSSFLSAKNQLVAAPDNLTRQQTPTCLRLSLVPLMRELSSMLEEPTPQCQIMLLVLVWLPLLWYLKASAKRGWVLLHPLEIPNKRREKEVSFSSRPNLVHLLRLGLKWGARDLMYKLGLNQLKKAQNLLRKASSRPLSSCTRGSNLNST